VAAIPTRRPAPPPRVLIASAAVAKRETQERHNRLSLPWQQRSFGYYDDIGEVRYAWHFYSRMLMPLRLYPALYENGRYEEIESGLPVELMDRIQDPGGGRKRIAKNYGRLQFGVGEGYLFGRNLNEKQEGEKWSFVSRQQLRFDDQGNVTHMVEPHGPDDEKYKLVEKPPLEELKPGTAVAYRMWTPHPQYDFWPDAPMRSVLDIAEELLLLTLSVMSTARSRLVRSPILKLPFELSPGAPEPTEEGGEEDPMNDPLLEQIIEHLEGVIDDPAAAAALAPFILWGSGEYLDKIEAVWLHREEGDFAEQAIRKETLGRLGTGLDMPREVIEGMIQGNHWSSWLITEDMFRNHGRPIADQYVGDFAEAYLRPALREAKYENWQNVTVQYDASAVTVNPDRGKDAQAAWDRGAIGQRALRDAMDFEEEDAPSEEEQTIWLLVKGRNVRPEQQDPNRNTPAGEDPNPEGPPPGEPGPTSERTNLPEASLVLGAAQMGLLRCRDRAGARLRTFRSICPECLEPHKEIRNGDLAATLGGEQLEKLGSPNPIDLVRGGSDWFQSTLLGWGYEEHVADALGRSLESFAARTLFDVRVPEVPVGLASFARRAA
jgi:hypothetical protein